MDRGDFGGAPAGGAFGAMSNETEDTAWISDDSEMQTPQFVAAHEVRGEASDDEAEVPSPAVHRDSHVPIVWAHAPRGADALNQWMDRSSQKPDFSALLSTATTVKQSYSLPDGALTAPTAVPRIAESAASSPSAFTGDVPREEPSAFASADHAFTSSRGASPERVWAALKRALAYLDATEVAEARGAWRLEVASLCVAELVAFSVQLSRGGAGGTNTLVVRFHRVSGDERRFLALLDCVRARCRDVDDDALPFADDALEPWMDARQELTGAELAPREALELVQQLRAELHPQTRLEVAKELKDRCRVRRNRATLYRVDPKHLLAGLQALLASDSLALSRLGVFVLLQFAGDPRAPAPFFHSPYERSAFAALLAAAQRAHRDAPCGAFVCDMAQRVLQSWLFAGAAS